MQSKHICSLRVVNCTYTLTRITIRRFWRYDEYTKGIYQLEFASNNHSLYTNFYLRALKFFPHRREYFSL